MTLDKLYAWTDIESTGLEKERYAEILEIGIIVTQPDFQELGRFHRLVRPSEAALRNMSTFVRDMHTESGLLEEVASAEPISVLRESGELVEFLRSFNRGDPKRLVPAGNNVRKFDIAMIERDVPGFEAELHYRQVDISTLWEGATLAMQKEMRPPKTMVHRALQDCLVSMGLFNQWRVAVGLDPVALDNHLSSY